MTGNASTTPAPLDERQLEQLRALTREMDLRQLDWTQGYLAGLRDAQSGSQPVPPSTTPPATDAVPVTVVYGSQTGNAETLAKELTARLESAGVPAKCVDMGEYRVRQLRKEQRLVIITSTHGEGDPPDNAIELHEHLAGRRAPSLKGVQFAVLALGDTSYEHFCQTGRDFDERLAALGAERMLERVDCDVDYDEPAGEWSERLCEHLAAGAASSTPATPSTPSPASGATPATSRYDRRNPFPAPVLERICLNGRGSSKDVYHLELSLEEAGFRYEPGDSLGVFVENDPALVERILGEAKLDGDEPVTVKKESLALREALTGHLELTRVTRPVVEQWAALSGSGELTALLEDHRTLMDWLHGRDVLDLMQQWPVQGLTGEQLAGVLRRLPPRLYSIASSQAAVEDEVHITVAAVRYHHEGRDRQGVASTWLTDRLEEDGTVSVYIDSNPQFRLPEDSDTPIIMVGPGTGIAPFRAFLQEREARGDDGRNWLFFGDRNFETDFLYQREWLQWRRQGLLDRIDVAFSRDTDRKIYVQHRIREAGEEVWRWLEEGARFYVCGDADAMAPDVHEALLDVVGTHGGKTREQAEAYVQEMGREKRYLRDVY